MLTVSAGPEVEFAASSPGAAVVASYRENGLKNDIDGWITDGMIHVPLPWGPTLVIDSDDGTYRLREGGMELLLHGRLHQPPMAPLSVVLAVVRMEGLP
ncbi:MAG TPA: hypothetical protein ENI87_05455 [bacterium]|nr:hypothetical protein [bacterium]